MNGKAAVFTAIGLVLGLLAGLAIGSNMGDERAAVSAPEVASLDEPATGTDAPLPVVPEPAPRTEPAQTREPATIADLMKSIEVPPFPTGAGEITGTVRSASGEPLAGAVVSAASSYPGDMGYNLKSAEERVAARMRYEKWREVSMRTATSGEDGAYRLTGLDESTEYQLAAQLTGWQLNVAVSGQRRIKAGESCDFVGHVTYELTATVLMPDGSPAGSGRVRAHQQVGSSSRTQQGVIAEGRAGVTLAEGAWTVYAEHGRDNELKSETIELEIRQGEAPAPVELRLKARAGIRGKILRGDSPLDIRARVYLQSNPPAEPPGDTLEREDRELSSSWGRDDYKFFDIAAGSYRLLLVVESRVVAWRDVAVGDALVELDLTLPDPDPADYIIVRVYDPGGRLLTNVNFNITRHRGGSSSGRGGGELLHSDGSYWLSKLSFSGDRQAEHHYTIKVDHSKYGSKTVRYEGTDTHELEIRYQDPALVTLTVANFNEHSLRDKLSWELRTGKSDVRSELRRYQEVSGGAKQSSPFKLGPVEPGEYELVLVTYSGGFFDSRILYRQKVTLTAGENSLSALVPELFTLTVLTGETRVSRITVRSKDGGFEHEGYRSRGSDDGKLVLEAIPPGTYVITSNEGTMEVVVSRDTEVQFEPRRYDCLVLTVKAGSYPETAGLRDGDKLIRVDGEVWERIELAHNLAQASMSKDSTTWTVLRGGIEIDIALNGKELLKDLEANRSLRMKPALKVE